jgi:pimeloyl-ACP methyl ester carboxylesterase
MAAPRKPRRKDPAVHRHVPHHQFSAPSDLREIRNEVSHDPRVDPNPFDPESVRAPSLALMALEWRAPLELGATLATLPLLARAGRGDGHTVLVFPGLAAGDVTTTALRGYLGWLGYDVYGWEQGLNLGARPGVVEGCRRRVMDLADRSGRAISVIGWSLGGIYAREVAKEVPQAVRCVITLGTPFTGHPRATNAWRLYELAAGHSTHEHPRRETLHIPPPRPTTSIYSKSDGVVAWQCSVNAPHPHTENIEVVASHIGLGMNPAALYAIADRLAQPEGNWRKFDRSGWRAYLYPNGK